MKKTFLGTIGTAVALGALTAIIPVMSVCAAGNISLDKAKTIALENAGLKENEVTFVKEGMEVDHGITKYEVEFYKGTTEYDYDIDAATGNIISFDREIETKYKTVTVNKNEAVTNGITKDQAVSIALANAGFKKSDVNLSYVKKDFEDGREIYEVEFYAGGREYNYDIAISNGQIVDIDIDGVVDTDDHDHDHDDDDDFDDFDDFDD